MQQKATADTRAGSIPELSDALPTPVRPIQVQVPDARTASGSRTVEIWLKDDGLTSQLYGGNKVRKLAHLLRDAVVKNKSRIVTFGAAGSHHVLATTLHARELGLRTLAWLAPQPRTRHAEDVLRAAIGAGLEAVPLAGAAFVPKFLRRLARDDYWIAPGGMGALGSSGYYDAAAELADQVAAGDLPDPDWIVVAAGSGSTAAGLLAGLARTSLESHLLGVLAASNPAIRPIVLGQALATARLRGTPLPMVSANARLDFERGLVGQGYGHPARLEPHVVDAMDGAALSLDPTYTQKSFAAAIALAAARPAQRILFWNTLSSAPLGPVLASAPSFAELPRELQNLLSVAAET